MCSPAATLDRRRPRLSATSSPVHLNVAISRTHSFTDAVLSHHQCDYRISQSRNEKMTSPWTQKPPRKRRVRSHAATTTRTTGEHDGGRGGPCTLSESRRCTQGARHTRGEPVSLWDSRTSARESWPFPQMEMEPNAFMLGRDGWLACPGYARGGLARGMPGDPSLPDASFTPTEHILHKLG